MYMYSKCIVFTVSMVTDIDQDGLISREDMYNMLDMITDEPLGENVKKKVVDEVRKSTFLYGSLK